MHLTGYLPVLIIILDIFWICASQNITQVDVQHRDIHELQMQTSDLDNVEFNLVDHGSGEVPSKEEDEQSEIHKELEVSETVGQDHVNVQETTHSGDYGGQHPADEQQQHETAGNDDDQEDPITKVPENSSVHIPVIDNEFEDIIEDEKEEPHKLFSQPNATGIIHPRQNDLEETETGEDEKISQDDVHAKSNPHQHHHDSFISTVEDFLPANNDSMTASESDRDVEFSGGSGDVPVEATKFPEDSDTGVTLALASKESGHPTLKLDKDATRRPVLYAGTKTKEKCQEVGCEAMYPHLHVTTSSSGGLTIPSGTVLVVRCTARTFSNVSVNISWELPSKTAIDTHHSFKNDSNYEDEARISESEETILFSGNREQVIIKTLTVANITEQDAGVYSCFTFIPQHCCQRNSTLTISIYDPPSYAAEYAIVGAVCFIEFLVIIYFKTKSHRKKRRTTTQRTTNGCSADYHRLPGAPQSKEKFEEVRQPLT